MYIKSKDLVYKQQKNRNLNILKKKSTWYDEPINYKKKKLFFKLNQLMIDLRFYKIFLIKCRKKIIKFKIKTYIYLELNKKTSYKSKNTRMGKGKGLNNKFFFKLKKNKPIIVFKNISQKRFTFLLKFLKKFYYYF